MHKATPESYEVEIREKGQLTIPAGIRHKMGIKRGQRAIVVATGDGQIQVILTGKRSLKELRGCLGKPPADPGEPETWKDGFGEWLIRGKSDALG